MQMKPRMRMIAVGVVIMAGTFLLGCGGGGGSSTSLVPSILNINSSTSPSSPVGLPIEINGSAFLSAPGKVVITQGSIVATVVPSAGGWSDTGIVAVVPTGDGTTAFTVPGTVTVTVVTSNGTSNGVAVSLVQTLTFDPSLFRWTATTALPTGLTGHRAVAVPVNSTSAFVVVAGGFNGTNNSGAVLLNTLASDGNVGATWTVQGNSLPSPRAHFGMVEADPGNSLVPAASRFIYVIGGQVNSSDTPGGMANVFVASVNVTSSTVGGWTELTATPLPQPLVGPALTLSNGYIYVAGGLTTAGAPSTAVYSAKVQSDGTLSAWSTSANPYPVAVSFAPAFGFGGKLYVLGGDGATSTNPNDQGSPTSGVNNVNFASTRNGVVGAWTATAGLIKGRKKQISWTAFGQVIDAEGIYSGAPGSTELERNVIQADGTLTGWGGLTGVNAPNANVYNAAAFVSPLQSPTATPRFLLLGGQTFSTVPPGPLSAKVFFNSAP